MDYRKIGQILERDRQAIPSARPPVAREIGHKSLGELGLLGLVERLALAIRSARRPPSS